MTRYIYLLFVAFLILLGIDILAGSQGFNPVVTLGELRVEEEGARCGNKRYESYEKSFTEYEEDRQLEERISIYYGGIWSVYTLKKFNSLNDTQREHVVSRRESFLSGLCTENNRTKISFTTEILNLVLSSPRENQLKGSSDWKNWNPQRNKCFVASKIVRIKQIFDLSVDFEEKQALLSTLRKCKSFELER